MDDGALGRGEHLQGELQLSARVDKHDQKPLCYDDHPDNLGRVELPSDGALHYDTRSSVLWRMGHCCFQIS